MQSSPLLPVNPRICLNLPPGNTPPPVEEVPVIIPAGNENYLNLKSDYIFDQNKLPTFELTLPPEHLAEIDADPAAEKYVEGSMIFEGETLSPVGIRYKGSVGAFVNCLSGTNLLNPSGHKICTKLSMKVKVNWTDTDDKFYGLKKLQFHSQNLDNSQLKERLGYWLFQQMGVAAPRSIHARLIINGEYQGLFALTEQIDGRFTRFNYGDGTGNLYKEIWPINSNGVPHNPQSYLNALETNEEDNPSPDMIRTFGQEIANADVDSVGNVIIKWMDLDEIMAYIAVDRTIRVDDGAFHWYCNGFSCSNHNYFWYEDPTQIKMHLIPWDMDNAFENIISDVNPVTPIADEWGEISNNCEPFVYGSFQFSQRSAACDKLTAGWVSFEAEYEQKILELKEGPLSVAAIDAQLTSWIEQIRSATVEASEKHGDAISVSAWEAEIQNLISNINYARNN